MNPAYLSSSHSSWGTVGDRLRVSLLAGRGVGLSHLLTTRAESLTTGMFCLRHQANQREL